MKVSIFWFRRDLRLEDNTALYTAVNQNSSVLPIFIFDDDILDELPKDDARVHFIYKTLESINRKLNENGTSILILKGKTEDVWKKLIQTYSIENVYINKDYEPYAIKRDQIIANLLYVNGIQLYSYKDQVIHEESEVMKADGTPYTVFTPYKNKWLERYSTQHVKPIFTYENMHRKIFSFPKIEELGKSPSTQRVRDYDLKNLSTYAETRNFPGLDSTSYLSPHLRFGTVSVRQVIEKLRNEHQTFLNELIWREFFMQILFHFPHVVSRNFRAKYDGIKWQNDEDNYEKWCAGKTGYPMVDAGMRQLNETGYMHNRVRMITAGFLCKHLLIDWRWGESYFANKLLDYELSSNNGNWQWAAGTGCDAAPYFRIFNPITQAKKFDKDQRYVRKWISGIDTSEYPKPIVDHSYARKRALETYAQALR